METRLTSQWRPLHTFIQDLKAGVAPWLAPSPSSSSQHSAKFQLIDTDAVDKVVQEIVKKNAEKEVKGEANGEEGLVPMEVPKEEEEWDGGREWMVVEVWNPPAGSGSGGGKTDEDG